MFLPCQSIEFLKTLLVSGGDLYKYYGESPIEYISKWGNKEYLKVLLEEYVNRGYINQKIDSNGNYLIHYAAKYGDKNTIEHLLNNMDDINVVNKDGQNAINYMDLSLYTNEVNNSLKQLLKAGLDPTILNNNGESALSRVNRDYNNNEASKLILSEIASHGSEESINRVDKYGLRPLDYAVNQKDSELFSNLVKKGADVNAKDNDGNTFLHKAFNEFHYGTKNANLINDYINIAIQNGFDPLSKNLKGNTIFTYLNSPINYSSQKAEAMRELLNYTKSTYNIDQDFALDNQGNNIAYYEGKVGLNVPYFPYYSMNLENVRLDFCENSNLCNSLDNNQCAAHQDQTDCMLHCSDWIAA